MRLKVKVVPKSSRNAVAGWLGEALKVCVTTAPEKGRANDAVVDVLSEALALPKSAIRIISGHTARYKDVEIDTIDLAELQRRIQG